MLRKITLASVVGLMISGCAGSAPNSHNDQTPLPVRSDLQNYQLDNGLQVYLLQRNQPGVELRLLVKSG